MAKRIELQAVYNKWTILQEVEKTTARNFLCKCECGNTSIVRIDQLTTGSSKGCRNCANKHKKHGDYKTRLYIIWMGMNNRCSHKEDYKSISICSEWKDYTNFKEWSLLNGYSDELTLDRKDYTGNYEPSNCRWVTFQVQAENQRLIYKTNTSGYKGVSFHKHSQKWRATISILNKKKHIGFYETKEAAALAYNTYILENNLTERKLNKIKELS